MYDDASDQPRPVLRVVRGNPTAEELAALVGALVVRWPTTGSRAGTAAPAVPVSRWRVSYRPTIPLRAGPGAWRAAGLPH